MNYRESTALLREAESRDNLAVALKGGKAAEEFREQRLALERERKALEAAAGGSKRLADSEAIYKKRVAEAEAEATRLSRAAADDIRAGTVALDERKQELDEWQARLDERKTVLDAKAGVVSGAVEAVERRQDAAETPRARQRGRL